MKTIQRSVIRIFSLLLLIASSLPARGQMYEKVVSFTDLYDEARAIGGDHIGASVSSMIEGPDGHLYGTTRFSNGGNIYGGNEGPGTIFRMTRDGAFSTVFTFSETPGALAGPRGTLEVLGVDGRLYGLTREGGAHGHGSVFRMSRNGDFTVLCSFTGTQGSALGKRPLLLFQSPDGNFYGLTESGGADDAGTVFRMNAEGQLVTLVELSGVTGPHPGREPTKLLLASNGYLYGITAGGGSNDAGTVFKVSITGAFQLIADFTGSGGIRPGLTPVSLIESKPGTLVGTTSHGGSTFGGVLFAVQLPGTYQTVVEFEGTNGGGPDGNLVVDPSGSVYGMTDSGGSRGGGTLFRLSSEGQFETLHSFPDYTDEYYLESPAKLTLVGLRSGGVIGSLGYYLANAGEVFRVDPDGHYQTIKEFPLIFTRYDNPAPDGYFPECFIQSSDGAIYVGSDLGLKGVFDCNGIIFRIDPASWNLDPLVWLGVPALPLSPSKPMSGLIQGNDGVLFGTSYYGGEYERGSVYSINPAGNLDVIFSFPEASTEFNGPVFTGGMKPRNPLALGSNNMLYGVTSAYYDDEFGFDTAIAYRVSPQGMIEWLVPPLPELIEESGQYRSRLGGFVTNPNGAMFMPGVGGTLNRLGTQGDISFLEGFLPDVFIGPDSSSFPLPGPIVADGFEIYGTFPERGTYNHGIIYRTHSIDGSPEILASLDDRVPALNGRHPLARLTKGSDGSFYGTASAGGVYGHGTVFRMTPLGVLTKLADFTGEGGDRKGREPASGLLEHEGWFYGTTNAGGGANIGTVFRISADGSVFESLFDFENDFFDSVPMGDLTLGPDGNIYGTTRGSDGHAETGGRGSVYRLVLPGTPLIHSQPVELKANTTALVRTKFNPRGEQANLSLEYSIDGIHFTMVPVAVAVGGFRTINLGTTLSGLVPGETYIYRFVASYAGGTVTGSLDSFDTIGPPVALADSPTGVTRNTATLHGTARAGNATSFLTFEYGTDGNTFPFAVVPTPVFANGSNEVPVSVPVNIEAGTTYYYRLTASNSAGISVSGVRTFTTLADPEVTVGGAFAVGNTAARLEGTVNARGSEGVNVAFEYGIGETVLGTVTATPSVVGGNSDTPVEAVLSNLLQGTEYFYRVKANAPGLEGVSATATFTMDVLSGFEQALPGAPPPSEGFLFVTLSPSGVGGGWRFLGEQQWRASGVPAGGLTTGDREIEFRPVAGYIQPPRETVSVISGEAATFVQAEYFVAASAGSGGLTVTLKPDSITTGEGRARWRFLGEDDTKWRDSGESISGLAAGTYLVECSQVAGRSAPPPAQVRVDAGETPALTLTYFLNEETSGSLPVELTFSAVSGNESMPYAHVGQIRSAVGAGTGFVVKPRVVATAAHVVWDDGTLSAASGVRWLFQQHRGVHETRPVIPRGFHMLTGYAAARSVPGVQPGEGTPESQNLDVAALYFADPAGRGGFSGYLASDLNDNEFLLSDSPKLLVGYPLSGIASTGRDRMHATLPSNLVFERVNGRVFRTTGIRSFGGNSGGPLCVLFEGSGGSAYYPAAIYLGGGSQTLVRAIDGDVADLFNEAEESSSQDDNGTGDGVSHIVYSAEGNDDLPGALKVIIEPAAAVEGGARWRFAGETNWRLSGSQRNNLTAGAYLIEFLAMDGYTTPSQQAAVVTGGVVATLTVPYQAVANPLEQWRSQYFGASPDPTTSADDADPDGDGVRNIDEYIAGTNPLDASDRFAILTTAKGSGGFTVSAAGKTGRRYTLQRRESPAGGTWNALTSLGPLSNDGPVTLTDPAPPPGQAFYRLGVSMP